MSQDMGTRLAVLVAALERIRDLPRDQDAGEIAASALATLNDIAMPVPRHDVVHIEGDKTERWDTYVDGVLVSSSPTRPRLGASDATGFNPDGTKVGVPPATMDFPVGEPFSPVEEDQKRRLREKEINQK